MYEWTEMSFHRFPSFQNSFDRNDYESWDADNEIEETEDEECLD